MAIDSVASLHPRYNGVEFLNIVQVSLQLHGRNGEELVLEIASNRFHMLTFDLCNNIRKTGCRICSRPIHFYVILVTCTTWISRLLLQNYLLH